MNMNNPPKFYLLVLALVCITVLLALRVIDPAVGTGLIGSIIGYGIGNGIAAKNGDPVQPVFGPKGDTDGRWLQAPDGSWHYVAKPTG